MTPFRAALVSIVLIGMAGLQVAGAPNPQLQVDGSWKRLRSQNFVAVGDANAGELRRALSELEGFRKALLEIFPSLRVTSPVGRNGHPLIGEVPVDRLRLLRGRCARADDDGQRTEAHAYVGIRAALAGRRDEAIVHLQWVKERGNRDYVEHRLAVRELSRLQNPSR